MSHQEYNKLMEEKIPGWLNLESYIKEVSYYLYCAVLRAENELAVVEEENINTTDSKYTTLIVEAVKNLSETKSTYEKDLEFIKQTYFKKEITDSTEMFHVEHEEQPEDQKFINFMNSRNENWRDIYNQDTIKEIKTAYEEVLLQQQIKTVTESVYSGVFPQFTAIHKVFIDYQNAVDNLNELIDQNVKRK